MTVRFFDENTKMCVYKITHKESNKTYIGQTQNRVGDRWCDHTLGNISSVISRAIKKYGENNFIFEVIDQGESLVELNEKEIFWIKESDSLVPNGYNLTTGGLNFSHSEETKYKISLSAKGRRHRPESIEKMRIVQSGKIISDEAKQKMRLAKLGKPVSEAHRNKISMATMGKKVSDQTKANMRKAQRLLINTMTEEQRLKKAEHCRELSRLYHVGKIRPHSEETKKRISEAYHRRTTLKQVHITNIL